jgi:hypothetical protein
VYAPHARLARVPCASARRRTLQQRHAAAAAALSTVLGPYLTKRTLLRNACLRGAWGVEVVTLMLAWKVALPQYVVTLRGNHESAFATQMYGFGTELTAKYATAAKPLYKRFLKARAACARRVLRRCARWR